MRKNPTLQAATEEKLRQSAPRLHAPDPARVAKACMRIASAPPHAPLRQLHTFAKPLLRVAACLALLFGVARLLRPTPKTAAVPAWPSITFNDLATLMGTQDLENTLAGEASALAADLAELTAVLNDRTLAILF
ncbi:MAG: hypothetical protein WCK89_13920 [bacterium]